MKTMDCCCCFSEKHRGGTNSRFAYNIKRFSDTLKPIHYPWISDEVVLVWGLQLACIYKTLYLSCNYPGNSYYYLQFVNEETEAQIVRYQKLNSSTEPKSSTSWSKKERASSEGLASRVSIEAYRRSFQTGTPKLGTTGGLQGSAWDYRQNYRLEVCVRERKRGPIPFNEITVFSDSRLLIWLL